MKHTLVRSLAAVAALSLGIAACGGSSASGGGKKGAAATGKPLVIETTALSPMTDTFNPFQSTSTGYSTHAVDLYQLPLFVFNTLDPTQAPIPELGTQYAWSNGGKTLTVTARSGAKWSDGKPFSAADIAFTFNLIKKFPALNVPTTPVPASSSASGSTATLNFSQAEYANLYLILQTQILPQHIWASIANPVTFKDPNPVGSGPYVLDKFSPQGYTLKVNPNYWGAKSLHVPEVDFPSYTSNANLVTPVASGAIDWAGNSLTGVQENYLSKSPDNHTWLSGSPFMSDNNVVGLWFNVTKAPLNDAAVRQAISYGINRQQLSTDGESSTEPPETTSSGLLLPVDKTFLSPDLANNLSPTGDAAKVSKILTKDGYKKVGGMWTKNGQKINFSIMDPVIYSDYYQDSQLIVKQLDALGINAKVDGLGGPNGPNVWTANLNSGNFSAAIHWGAQGTTPYFFYNNWLNYSLSAPIGKTAAADYGRFNSPAAQSALNQYASSGDPSVQQSAITKLENIMDTQVPVAPLLLGASWAEFSTRNYTGWPSPANAYMDPGPNIPEVLYTITQLKPVH
jgi:peptide/nickel transport system substrate-binding protein